MAAQLPLRVGIAGFGTIDIVLVPVDGSFTLNQSEMIEVLKQLKAKIAIPMHVFTEERWRGFWRAPRSAGSACGTRPSRASP